MEKKNEQTQKIHIAQIQNKKNKKKEGNFGEHQGRELKTKTYFFLC